MMEGIMLLVKKQLTESLVFNIMIMMKLLIKTNTMNRISFKLKFRPSINPNKEGALYIQMIYQRKVRRIQTE